MAQGRTSVKKPRIAQWLSFIGPASLLITLATCVRADDTWERVRTSGTWRVGMDASFPPFESVAADGSLVGFDVDLAWALGRHLGVEVQFVANLPYDGLYDALTVGRVDALISALVVNPARMADYAYSTPYFDAGQVLVVPAGSSIETMDDLEGSILAVELGSRGDMEARRRARRLPGLTVVPYQTATEALDAVTKRGASAALVDHVSALAALQTDSSLCILGHPVVSEPYAVAVRRDSPILLQAINQALAQMQADGMLDILVARWLIGSQYTGAPGDPTGD